MIYMLKSGQLYATDALQCVHTCISKFRKSLILTTCIFQYTTMYVMKTHKLLN